MNQSERVRAAVLRGIAGATSHTITDQCVVVHELHGQKALSSLVDAIADALQADGLVDSAMPYLSSSLENELSKIDKLCQRQDSMVDQLRVLRPFANRLGLYDAADYIRNVVANTDRQIMEIETRHAAARTS